MDNNQLLSTEINIDNILDEVHSTVASVCKNLKDVLVDIVGSESFDIDSEVKALQQVTRSIQENITFVIARSSSNEQTMALDKKNHLDVATTCKTKYHNLQKEWENQQEHMGKLQGEMFKLRNLLKHQSSYCAALGATLGKLIWKVSKQPGTAASLIEGIKPSEFLCITTSTLECFIETYSNGFPDSCTNEMSFMLSLIGTVANIAVCPNGREFLTSDPNGKALIHKIFQIMPRVPVESGDGLQRVLMMALYNISINQKGFLMIQGEKNVLQTISRHILHDRSPELKMLALRLLMSLSVHIPSVKMFKFMCDNIPLKEISELRDTTDALMRSIARNIIKSLEETEAKFKKEKPHLLQVNVEDCRLLKNQHCCDGGTSERITIQSFLISFKQLITKF